MISRARVIWLVGYMATMGVLVAALWYVREVLVPQLSTRQAQADWDEWQSAARSQTGEKGPVSRKPPKAAEPPTLILLRDHFVLCLGAVLVFGSSLYFVVALFVAGIWRQRHSENQPETAT